MCMITLWIKLTPFLVFHLHCLLHFIKAIPPSKSINTYIHTETKIISKLSQSERQRLTKHKTTKQDKINGLQSLYYCSCWIVIVILCVHLILSPNSTQSTQQITKLRICRLWSTQEPAFGHLLFAILLACLYFQHYRFDVHVSVRQTAVASFTLLQQRLYFVHCFRIRWFGKFDTDSMLSGHTKCIFFSLPIFRWIFDRHYNIKAML